MRDLLERVVQRDEIVEVKIKKGEVNFLIWLIPLIALVIGGWMVYRYYAKLGPEIVLYFKNSGGLEPKQSFVKFRDVKVGVVERIEILRQKEGVAVYARMNRDVAPFLNDKAKFWIVKPEITAGRVRGLDALVSGSYIQMVSELGGEERREFQGLDEAPLDIVLQEGRNYHLKAPSSYSLTAGLPVYYKDIEVGSIKRVELDREGRYVNIYIFVKKPYDRFVNASTRFWNIRGVDLTLADSGIKLKMGSVSQLLLGGIAFATPNTNKDHEAIDLRHSFWLYGSKEEALRKRLGILPKDERDFMLYFSEGVGYLQKGAPVRFAGFEVGKVKDIEAFVEDKKIQAKVFVTIDVAAFKRSPKEGIEPFAKAVRDGLKARLEQSNILTKSLFVNLVFAGKAAELRKSGAYYLLPTLPSSQNVLYDQLLKILQKLQHLPIERSLNAFSHLLEQNSKPLQGVLEELQRLSSDLRTLLESNATAALPQTINITLQKLGRSIETLTKSYDHNSSFNAQLSQTLHDIDKASKVLHKVLLKIDKKPNALIFGE